MSAMQLLAAFHEHENKWCDSNHTLTANTVETGVHEKPNNQRRKYDGPQSTHPGECHTLDAVIETSQSLCLDPI